MGRQAAHRPGPFKQSNKLHKGGHKKKDSNDKGKTGAKALTLARKIELNRKDRKNRASQLRTNKRDEALMKKRGLVGVKLPPILVGIIPLNPGQDPCQLLEDLKDCDEGLLITYSEKGHCHISFPRLKHRFTFVCPKIGNLNDVLDIAKVADVLLLVHSLDELDDYAETLLSSILCHSLPTTIHAFTGLNGLNPKKKSDIKKAVLKSLESRFTDEKLHPADTKQDFLLLLRTISERKRHPIAFRDSRPHLLAENVKFVPDASTEESRGTLKVSGYIRGQPLSVNGLVHIPGWGDFQMSEIEYISDPHPLNSQKGREKSSSSMDEDITVVVDKSDPAEQESLQSEIIPDPMVGEQTWPTDEELREAEQSNKIVRKVAEGSSAYQASWIVDSGSEEGSSDSDDELDYEVKSDVSNDESQDFNMDDDQVTVADSVENGKYDEDLDMDEEKKTLVRFREERMEQHFPDEQDTPIDVAARVRYQRYRGLKSYKNSPWDPLEDLPAEYARIYHFENFRQTKKKVLESQKEKDGALPGLYVTLSIANVPASLYDSVESSPLIVYGILPHEQKMSCVNVVIRKHSSCTEPIKSKDRLIFHLGFRRFVCQPIFSEHSHGDKHKFLKFLPSSAATVATFFAPVVFPPCSVVVYQQKSDGTQRLVATGSVMDVNANRLIIKRIVLSGHPFKILKRSAVVRYMFFNREDIAWFKPVELYTKNGRRGHIREALGTHGHMKCVFDQQLKSQDVVLMSLYKRVFPKWTYDPCVPTPCSPYDSMDLSML